MKPIIILFIALILILVTLELCSKQIKPNAGVVQITDGKMTLNLSLNIIQKQMTQNAQAKRGSKWQGIYLAKFLSENGFDVKKYRSCTLIAQDKMQMVIPFDEITDNQAFLSLSTDKKSTKKSLKLVMLQDPFEQRWLKYIVKIVLE